MHLYQSGVQPPYTMYGFIYGDTNIYVNLHVMARGLLAKALAIVTAQAYKHIFTYRYRYWF